MGGDVVRSAAFSGRRFASTALLLPPTSSEGGLGLWLLVSLWQMNLVAIKLIRFINWSRTVSTAVRTSAAQPTSEAAISDAPKKKPAFTKRQLEVLAAGLLPVLRPLAEKVRALEATNHELLERCHSVETRILELGADAASRDKVTS